jgi:hypothetical protein
MSRPESLAKYAITTRTTSAIAMCITSTVIATYSGILFSRGQLISDEMWQLHQFLFTMLVATWFVADSRARGRFSPTFDHGWMILMVLPFFALYHLIATRRWWGVAIALGLIGLLILPSIAQVLVYLAS